MMDGNMLSGVVPGSNGSRNAELNESSFAAATGISVSSIAGKAELIRL